MTASADVVRRLHFEFFHYGFEFFSICVGIGRIDRQIPKKINIRSFVQLIGIHACKTANTVKVIVSAYVKIAVVGGPDHAWMSSFKLVIGISSFAAANTVALGDEFPGSHFQLPAPTTPDVAELAVPSSRAVKVPVQVMVTLLPEPT